MMVLSIQHHLVYALRSPNPWHLTFYAFPLYCVSKVSPRTLTIPAVRVCRSPSRWGVLPLSRQEFGAVWDTQESMSQWIETPLTEGWSNAEQEFNAITDYPVEILSAILGVLRTGKFHDGTPVTLSHWPSFCKLDVNKIGIKKIYTKCEQSRWFSPRALYTLPRVLSGFRCIDIGVPCIQPPSSSMDQIFSPNPPSLPIHAEEAIRMQTKYAPSRTLYPAPSTHDSSFFTTRETLQMDSTNTIPIRTPCPPFTYNPPFPSLNPSHDILPSRPPQSFPFEPTNAIHFPRHHPSRSYPHPRQFITGTEARVLECPAPTFEEIEEYSAIHDTPKWQNLLLALSRWAM